MELIREAPQEERGGVKFRTITPSHELKKKQNSKRVGVELNGNEMGKVSAAPRPKHCSLL